LDQENFGRELIQMLSTSTVIRLEHTSNTQEDNLINAVNDEEAAAAIIVPLDFSQSFLSDQSAPVRIIAPPASTSSQAIQGEVNASVLRLVSTVQTAQLSTSAHERLLGFNSSEERQAHFDLSLESAIEMWKSPPILLNTTATGASSDESENAFAQSSTGMMAQFTIAGLMGAATILVLERKTKALKRLLTTPISRAEILLGHYLAMFAMISIQLVILIVFGQLFLDLNYIGSPAATLLLIVVTSLFTASLGLLIGALAKTEEHVIVVPGCLSN
jgi:ABC-2 type transport system permease protein